MDNMANETNVQQQPNLALALPANYANTLKPEQLRHVEQLKASIRVHDRAAVTAFGQEQQMGISGFSDGVLKDARTKDIGEAGQMLAQVVQDISSYNTGCEKENSGIMAFFRKQTTKLENMRLKFNTAASNIDAAVGKLQTKKAALDKVCADFEGMYRENERTYQFLTMLIFAAEQVLAEERSKHQQMLDSVAQDDAMEIQRLAAFKEDIDRFERRLNDLRITRVVAIQQAPEINNIKKGAEQISEGIQNAIVTAIPIWKNQMAMALGMQVVKEGMDALDAVRNVTNAMLIRNSEMNRDLALQSAKAVERGVVDIETIKTVNQNLINAFQGSCEIAKEASANRQRAAQELQKAESELKAEIAKYSQI